MKKFNKEKFYNDIVYMFKTIKEKHIDLFCHISEKELNDLIENYMKDDSIDNYNKSINYLLKIFVKIGESHTGLYMSYNPSKYRFKILDGECIVCDSKDKEMIGYTLKSINGIDINKIMDELRETITPRTEEGIMSRIERSLTNKIVLNYLPSLESSDSIEYLLVKDGKEYRSKERIDEENNSFEVRNYEYKVLDNKVVIKYTVCQDMEDYTLKQMVEDISKIDNIDGYIIDLRGNGGGNSDLFKYLHVFLEDKNIVTIVDNAVFSSGIWALKALKGFGSPVIGTGICETMNGYGNVRFEGTPNYNIPFSYSTCYYTLDDNYKWIKIEDRKEYEEFVTKKENQKYLKPIYFTPDVYADITKDNIINGTDSVIDKAIDILNCKYHSI